VELRLKNLEGLLEPDQLQSLLRKTAQRRRRTKPQRDELNLLPEDDLRELLRSNLPKCRKCREPQFGGARD
jgi:hypothetical protein